MFDCIVSADNKEIVSLKVILNKDLEPNRWYSSSQLGLMLKCKSNKWKLSNSDEAEKILTKLNNEFNRRSTNTNKE